MEEEVSSRLPEADLEHILTRAPGVWSELRGQRLFITGGTGFFGSWLLESLLFANQKLGLGATARVLTRDPETFRQALPHLVDPAITLLQGDVKTFDLPKGPFDLILHAATTNARETFAGESALAKYDTLALGTRRVLALAQACGARRMLFTSSGVVYGKQPAELERIPEDYAGGPVPGYSQRGLAEGKRAAEFQCQAVAEMAGFDLTIARCFSFVGPRLPLDIHYAIGNFIRDALAGGPIVVQGDGLAQRAYLYAADLTAWLWTMLLKAPGGSIYNVGSEEAVSIAELAHLVSECVPSHPEVRVLGRPTPGAPPDRYVPSIQRARQELGLEVRVGFRDAIERTAAFQRQSP